MAVNINGMDFNEVEMSNIGIEMLLNNQWDAASRFFLTYKDQSPLMFAGAGWVNHLQAMMSFEEDKQQSTMKLLQQIEKQCGKVTKVKKKHQTCWTVADRLQRQLIVADSLVHQALITFLNQDVPSYIKGGWLVRKAYNLYEKLYKQIRTMYIHSLEASGAAPIPGHNMGAETTASHDAHNTHKANKDSSARNGALNGINHTSDSSDNKTDLHVEHSIMNRYGDNENLGENSGTNSVNTEPEDTDVCEEVTEALDDLSLDSSQVGDNMSNNEVGDNTGITDDVSSEGGLSVSSSDVSLPHDVIERLYGSACFGHGLFQLVLSLIPPKVIKVVEFLGFDCDREEGLRALGVSSKTKDMKAPLASLATLWYHTMMRPFFSLDGDNITAGAVAAQPIIDEFDQRYPNSGLFLFFKGRAQRLKCELDLALMTYQTALDASTGQREMEMMSCHEIGWIAMMKLNVTECVTSFTRLRENTQNSKSYYAYLSAISYGACGDLAAAKRHMKEVPGLVRKKNNEIELFALSRAKKFEKRVSLTPENCVLYLIEVVYLWSAISQCPPPQVTAMIKACDAVVDKSVFHLKCLLEGALYKQAGRHDVAKQCCDEGLARCSDMKHDTYVAAWTRYELGLLQCANAKTFEEGRKNLVKARDGHKDFDFDNRLHVKINNALKRIETTGTPL